MNKDVIYELMELRNDVSCEKSIKKDLKKVICNRISSVIIDLMDESREDDWLALKKTIKLADAIDRGDIKLEEAEKMAQGGTD